MRFHSGVKRGKGENNTAIGKEKKRRGGDKEDIRIIKLRRGNRERVDKNTRREEGEREQLRDTAS